MFLSVITTRGILWNGKNKVFGGKYGKKEIQIIYLLFIEKLILFVNFGKLDRTKLTFWNVYYNMIEYNSMGLKSMTLCKGGIIL